MNTKKTIKRILFFSMWLVIGSGMLMLLIAAMGKQKRATCKNVEIVINANNSEDLFLDEKDVMKLLSAAAKGKLVGQPKTLFDLQQMEELLEDNVWVKEAQLYFDNQDVLHVTISERIPVARVFTTGGRSFYIDENSQMMQLSDKVSMKLPVFTGFPEKKRLDKKDSLLLTGINDIAAAIQVNPFWEAQTEQLDITPCGPGCWEFDMIPLVGSHTIKLGTAVNINQKLNRAFLFYKQVLAKSGFDKYKTIDVRYDGQVVGGKTENPKVDSVQLRKSVEALLRQIKEAETNAALIAAQPAATAIDTSTTSRPATVKPVATNPKPAERPAAVKPVASNPKPSERPAAIKPAAPKLRTTVRETPRAVMPKR